MIERVFVIVVKELKQILRDPRMRFVLVVAPLFQMLIFGYAARIDIPNVRTAVYDRDQTPASRSLIARFRGSNSFQIIGDIHSPGAIDRLLDTEQAQVVLHINDGFSENLTLGRTASLQVIVDGTNSNSAGVIMGYVSRITARYNREVLVDRLQRALPGTPGPSTITARIRSWFNPNLSSRWFYVPGVIVLIVMVTTLLLSSLAIVREKEIGTIEQIMVSPISRGAFILGKLIPFALIGMGDVVLITVVSYGWFEVPIRGSMFLLFAGTALFLLGTLGIGLFISTISHTQQEAMLSAFLFQFPAVLLSGFVFPIEFMPLPARMVTYLNPLRYYMNLVRGLFLKGAGPGILWPEMAGMLAVGLTIMIVATARFQKQL